jgi:hypothetical protein
MSGLHSDYNRVVRWLHAQSNANSNGDAKWDANSICNADRYTIGDSTYADPKASPDGSAASHPITILHTGIEFPHPLIARRKIA